MWKTVNYIKNTSDTYDYQIVLPEPLANWDVFDYWEKERIISMRSILKKDDVLFDIGAEHGWLSVVYATMCDNIFLIEPTSEFWANIYETWKRNVKFEPVGCFQGLLGTKSDCTQESFDFPQSIHNELITVNKYEYLHQHSENIKTLSLDDLVRLSNVIPTALTIDVEGAEQLVLSGAIETLKKYKPKLWVSIHPDLMLRDYKSSLESVVQFLSDLEYKAQYLATDHEEHWYFSV